MLIGTWFFANLKFLVCLNYCLSAYIYRLSSHRKELFKSSASFSIQKEPCKASNGASSFVRVFALAIGYDFISRN